VIWFNCECGKRYAVGDDSVGKRIKCPNCGRVTAVGVEPAPTVDWPGAGATSGPAPKPVTFAFPAAGDGPPIRPTRRAPACATVVILGLALVGLGAIALAILALIVANRPVPEPGPAPKSLAVSDAPPRPRLTFPPHGPYAHDFTIEAGYDKFRNVSLLRLPRMPAGRTPGMPAELTLIYEQPGQDRALPTADESITVDFATRSDLARFDEEQVVYLVYGNSRAAYRPAEYRLERRGALTYHHLSCRVPLPVFLDAVRDTPEFRAGRAEAGFTPEGIEALRDFASRLGSGLWTGR
jgi:hypothetical protein